MALDPTVGGTASNSYVDLAEANAYFATRLDSDAWTEAGATSPPRQERALITAAYRLDQEEYRGEKASSTQALAWPRAGIPGVDSTAIPVEIKRAQMELALALLTEETSLADTGLEAFENIKIGPIDITPRQRSAGALPAHVRRFLKGLLAGSAVQFRIVRG